MILLLCGLSGSGKTTLAKNVQAFLIKSGIDVEILDGDDYRENLFKELTYSKESRVENSRRLGFLANRFSSHGIVSIICAINPYEEIRQELVKRYKNVKIVYVDCPLENLITRDTKGLYKRALLPHGHPDKIYNLTGVNDRFDIPENPDLVIHTHTQSISCSTAALLSFVDRNLQKLLKSIPPVQSFNSL